MSIPGSASPLLLASTAAAAGGYQISRSLRFNSADSAFLDRAFSVTGNQTTATFSCWLKRSRLGVGYDFTLYDSTTTNTTTTTITITTTTTTNTSIGITSIPTITGTSACIYK